MLMKDWFAMLLMTLYACVSSSVAMTYGKILRVEGYEIQMEDLPLWVGQALLLSCGIFCNNNGCKMWTWNGGNQECKIYPSAKITGMTSVPGSLLSHYTTLTNMTSVLGSLLEHYTPIPDLTNSPDTSSTTDSPTSSTTGSPTSSTTSSTTALPTSPDTSTTTSSSIPTASYIGLPVVNGNWENAKELCESQNKVLGYSFDNPWVVAYKKSIGVNGFFMGIHKTDYYGDWYDLEGNNMTGSIVWAGELSTASTELCSAHWGSGLADINCYGIRDLAAFCTVKTT